MFGLVWGAGGEEVRVGVGQMWVVGGLGSGGRQIRGGWIDELVYLVSVVGCVCVRLVLVLSWTQCIPQGVGAPSDRLRGRTAGFPQKLGLRRGGAGGYNLQCSPALWHTNHEQAVSVWCTGVLV